MPKVSDEYRAERREQIIQAAMVCFERDGFHAASMDDVIAEVGLSAGAVYRYFPGKDAIVSGVVQYALGAVGRVLSEAADTDRAATPSGAVDVALEKLEELRFSHTVKPERIALFAWSEALRNEALHREVTIGLGQVRAAIQSLVLRWQQSGLVQPDADPQEIGLAFLAWIPGFFIQHHVAGIVQRDQFVRGVAGLLNPVRDPIA